MVLLKRFRSIIGSIGKFFLPLNCLFLITTWASGQAVPENHGRDDRIGVCTHFSQNWPVEQIMPLIAKSGAGWIRDDLGWGAMEPKPGKYQIPLKTRNWIRAARQAGLKIDLILAYGNSAYADQYDTAAYAKAAGWLARELANDIQAIEILNEPNNFGFRDIYGGQWNGNERNGSVSLYLQKYVQILNAAAKDIKLANPNMTVIGLGTPAPASFRILALGIVPQVDGLTDHPYGTQMPELIPYAATPDILRRDGIATADAKGTFASQVSMFRAQARKFAATEKLWHTEWGYSTVRARPEKHQQAVSEEMQAAYILRRILLSNAIGVEHTFIYNFKNDGVDPYSDYQNFGLVRNDLSPKPSYFALQRVAGFLAGMQIAAPERQASIDPTTQKDGLGHQCYTFSSSDRRRTIVAFWEAKPWQANETASDAVITLPADHEPRHLLLYDLLSGNQTEVSGTSPGNNRISVKVSICGSPKLLIVRP
jgi:hypothetical protein